MITTLNADVLRLGLIGLVYRQGIRKISCRYRKEDEDGQSVYRHESVW